MASTYTSCVLRSRRGASRRPPIPLAWQAWRLATSTFVSRGRGATLSHTTLSNTTLISHNIFTYIPLTRSFVTHTQLCHVQLCCTQLCRTHLSHTQRCHPQLCRTQSMPRDSFARNVSLFLSLSFLHICVTHSLVTHLDQLCRSQSFARISRTCSFSLPRVFVTHKTLSHTHTTLSRATPSHAQLCHRPLCHTRAQIFHTRLCHTRNLSHTALSHATLSRATFETIDPPPSPLPFLLSPCRFHHFFISNFWKKLTCGVCGPLIIIFPARIKQLGVSILLAVPPTEWEDLGPI